MIIGVTGYIGAGKGEFVDLLTKEYGFVQVTFKEIILREAKRKGLQTDRTSLQELGKIMEKKGELASKVISGIHFREGQQSEQNYVVECFRTEGQVNAFREEFEKDFYLVGITADFDKRWGRIRERERGGDPSFFEDFRKSDDLDRKGEYQNTDWCVKHADKLIKNNGERLKFKRKVRDYMAGLGFDK